MIRFLLPFQKQCSELLPVFFISFLAVVSGFACAVQPSEIFLMRLCNITIGVQPLLFLFDIYPLEENRFMTFQPSFIMKQIKVFDIA